MAHEWIMCTLLREEDVDNLRIDVAERRYRRGEAIKLMQLRDRIEFEKVRTAGEGQVAVEQMRPANLFQTYCFCWSPVAAGIQF